MKVLIRQARIICSASPSHGMVKDILVNDGIIQQISDSIDEKADRLIEGSNLHISIGWADLFADFADPGYEHRESIETGARAAAAGGFTDIALLPNTNPPISSKTQVEYLLQKSNALPVNIHPLGAISKNAEGKELAEMYDMHASGAIAFTDGLKPVQNPGLMLKALQYVITKNACIIQVPDDKSIAPHGLMNEGIASTQLGLPGKPAIAEELMIARDIELLKYTGSKLHITGISTRKGVGMVAKAKAEGLNISCSVSPYHLAFCDEDLAGYDSNLKVNPPLRTRDDMMGLRDAFKNGQIDGIASHHIPLHWDDKACEFEYAKNGMIGLESLFAVANTFIGSTEKLIEMLTVNSRNILGLPVPQITEGAAASLTIFDPARQFTFAVTMIQSRSRNTAFIGKELKGKVIGTIHNNKIVLNS